MSGGKNVDDVDLEGGESKKQPTSDSAPLYTNVALEQRKGGNVVPSAM